MRKLKTLFCTFIVILCLVTVSLPAGATPFGAQAPEVEASAALLIELNSGVILYEKDADTKIFPASLTKVMSCLVALENSQLNETVTVNESAFDGLGQYSSTAGLLVGEKLSMENLLYCMMLSSGNEACNVAAEHIFGSVDLFVEKMNEKAQALGCVNTHFANTHGLHDAQHYTTARDLSIIVKEALKNNVFKTIVATHTYKMPGTNLSGPRTLTTTNQMMLPTAGNPYYDKRVTGVKTGFTTPAGRCLIATASEGSISLLSIVTGCETRILPSGDLEFASFPETKKLLEFGFSNYTYETLLTTLYPLTEIPVLNSAGLDHLSLAPEQEISALLPKNYDKDAVTIVPSLVSNTGVEAPIVAGQRLGMVQLFYDGQLVGETALIAITDVSKASFMGLFQNKGGNQMDAWLLILLAAALLLVLIILIVVLVQIRKNRKWKRRYKARYSANKRTGAYSGRGKE